MKYLHLGNEYASKAGGHEIRSLRTLISCGIPHLHFPFMVAVWYQGYRFVCVSKLPINSSTLIYVPLLVRSPSGLRRCRANHQNFHRHAGNDEENRFQPQLETYYCFQLELTK